MHVCMYVYHSLVDEAAGPGGVTRASFVKHTREHHAFISTSRMHPQRHSNSPHGYDRHRQENHHKQELHSNPCSSVGTRMPAQNPVPLDFASIPKDARYINSLPLHSPTLSSCKGPATKHARSNPPAGLSSHNSPRRRAQRGSRLAPLVHALLASVGCAKQQLCRP
jgi:hypothetical protein